MGRVTRRRLLQISRAAAAAAQTGARRGGGPGAGLWAAPEESVKWAHGELAKIYV